ncbi:hypothetical protein VKT23_011345 [Stygiomarasmius scandens]|uniref:DUF6532 domain-containing protein n=1 Tax=Marasmiellus scandens TaxID=2682957 RepID=A0ABR1J9R6_9AGAR
MQGQSLPPKPPALLSSDEERDNAMDYDEVEELGDESGTGFSDQMVVEEVEDTSINRASKTKTRSAKKMPGKVTKEHFNSPQTIRLAEYGKAIIRMETCIGRLFQENDNKSWDVLIDALRNEKEDSELIDTVYCVNDDEHLRKLMIRYMSYGSGEVRYQFKKAVQADVLAYFGIPGKMSMTEVHFLVQWLTDKRKAHHGEVDCQKKTWDENAPFKSPLIPRMLHLFFFVSTGKMDAPLVHYLKTAESVPIPLIAMAASTIIHILNGYATGTFQKIEFSAKNMAAESDPTLSC